MGNDAFHFPANVMQHLIDAIPVLFRSKKDVILFFKGAGTPEPLYKPLARKVARDKDSIGKLEIARTILERLNEGGDATLGVRREVIKRVVEFEDFSHCWPSDAPKAKAEVAEIRRLVNVKDSFTRMHDEAEKERRRRQQEIEVAAQKRKERATRLEAIKRDFFSLFGIEDAHQRGRALERVLNALFKEHGILVREAFTRAGEPGEGVVEQIDGVIDLDGALYLVEMKWWKEKLGARDTGYHLARIVTRGNARGIIISNSGFSEAAVSVCKDALPKVTCVLCELEEIVRLLDAGKDLKAFIRAKVQAAIVDKNPLHRPLTQM